MLFSNMPRIRLLTEETPLEPIFRYGREIGHEPIWLKRDDVMPLGMGGNKVRSLEFWLGEAMSQSCDTVLVSGLPESNLCRLTAAACAKLGFKCVVIHNASQSAEPDLQPGNPLLCHLLGVERKYCGAVDEYQRADFVRSYADELTAQGHKPYIIGDQVVGAMGYVNAALELASQAERQEIDLRHVVISASAGPTEAGLLFGLCLFGKAFQVHFISVEYQANEFWSIIDRIFDGLCQRLKVTPPTTPREIAEFTADYLGEGYARPTPDCVQAVKQLARTEGIFLETTYNAKVFAALRDQCRSGVYPAGQAVCCFHTGGAPALFGQSAYF